MRSTLFDPCLDGVLGPHSGEFTEFSSVILFSIVFCKRESSLINPRLTMLGIYMMSEAKIHWED